MIDELIIMGKDGRVLCQGPPCACIGLFEHPLSSGEMLLQAASHEELSIMLQKSFQKSVLSIVVRDAMNMVEVMPYRYRVIDLHTINKCIIRFFWEIHVLSRFLLRLVFVNPYVSIVAPICFLAGGIILGLMFRDSFNPHSETPPPYFEVATLADSNFARTIESLAFSYGSPVDRILTMGVSGDPSKEDPVVKLLRWPTTYRWLYRSVHSFSDMIDLPSMYPDYGFSLWKHNMSFVNDYRDLDQFLQHRQLLEDDEFLDGDIQLLDSDVQLLDSDLDWDSIHFFTPRFMSTEINLLMQSFHYAWYIFSWEELQQCFNLYQINSGLVFYPCLLSNALGPMRVYFDAAGLPFPQLFPSPLVPPLAMAVSEPSFEFAAPPRQLFLNLNEKFPVFRGLKAISDSTSLDIYSPVMNFLRSTTDAMSVVAALFFLGASLGFVGMEYFHYYFLLRWSSNRDAVNHHYSRYAFFVSLNVAHLPIELLSSLALSLPVCMLIPLDSKCWFWIILISWLLVATMSSVHRLTCTLSSNLGTAVRATPLIVIVLVLFSGFFVRSANIPTWIEPWAKYLSPYRWAIFAMGLAYFENDKYSGPVPNNFVYAVNGIDQHSVGICIGILFCQLVVYKLLASIAFLTLHTKQGTI
eukprot:Gregarina_sp_Poly_1__4144@NODE_226_length_11195_cov_150_303648_g200_i0_p3_GENE_NODE_226_length_11195_cov_150_303648_g200_i0NODE_226_length_11195_cov_150_303648_g200_i0_p3_ORF_typecomplete_len637_score41_77ABC2_membrane/PF01061_24/3e02ABC2_membrane/PF01061_24/7_1e17ABC2_membrane_3/PF12698_7/2_4e03ABC2_membrane_3/PF12698_7/0_00032_NODE_226_length_11195_cov_150_303648_g200_i063848294